MEGSVLAIKRLPHGSLFMNSFLSKSWTKCSRQIENKRKSDESSGGKPSDALGIGGFRVFMILVA